MFNVSGTAQREYFISVISQIRTQYYLTEQVKHLTATYQWQKVRLSYGSIGAPKEKIL